MAQGAIKAITPEGGSIQPAQRRALSLPAWLILACIVTFSVLLWAGTVEEQSQALEKVIADYQQWLAKGSAVHSIPSGWITDPLESRQITSFFAWTAWAAAANRPGAPFSYTANFPHDPLIGNHPPAQFVIWSIVSVIVLIAAIAGFLLLYLMQEDPNEVQQLSQRPLVRLARAGICSRPCSGSPPAGWGRACISRPASVGRNRRARPGARLRCWEAWGWWCWAR